MSNHMSSTWHGHCAGQATDTSSVPMVVSASRNPAARLLTGTVWLAAVLMGVAHGVAAAESVGAGQPDPRAAIDLEELKRAVQDILDQHRIPGASIALVDRDGTIWAGGVGEADVAADVDVSADHLFRVGSIAKSITALGVMRAVEDGLLDLTMPVGELVPEVEFANRWHATDPVTVAMLMEHTAGFDDIRFREFAKRDDPHLPLAEALAYNPSSRESRWPPGTHKSYSNSGPAVAAYILERVTGQRFEDYAREHVLDPLGMTSATFSLPDDASLVAKGYQADGVTEARWDHIIFRPSGGLSVSARDMGRYLRMMINRGTLGDYAFLAPEAITRIETSTTTLAARNGFTYGYGLGNQPQITNGHVFRGHGGGITGFRAMSGYSSELGVGYYVSVNGSGRGWREIPALLANHLTDGLAKPEGRRTTLADDELLDVTGWYQNVTPRVQFLQFLLRFLAVHHVTTEGGRLFTSPVVGERKELVPVSPTSFRYTDEPVASMFLIVDREGNQILQRGAGGSDIRISGAWLTVRSAIAAATLMLLISGPLFALVWVPGKLAGRFRTVRWWSGIFPVLAALSLIGYLVVPFALVSDPSTDLGRQTAISTTIYLGSFVFLGLTLASLYTSARAYFTEMSRFARLHGTLVSLACAAALIYLWGNGLIALQTWVY